MGTNQSIFQTSLYEMCTGRSGRLREINDNIVIIPLCYYFDSNNNNFNCNIPLADIVDNNEIIPIGIVVEE